MTKSLEERIDDFGDEMEDLGERLGEDIENFGRDIESSYRSFFGLAGPFLWSIVGLILLGVLVWILYWIGETIPSALFVSTGDFILDHLALFFLLMLVFNYFSYFSKRYPYKSKYISPIFTALSIVIWIWIITSLILLLEPRFAMIRRTILSIHENLLTIFVLVLIISYLLLVINEGKKSERRSGTMDYEDDIGYEDDGWKKDREKKRLYRSGKDKLLGGVCGGIGEYFDVDPVIIRLIWVVLAIASLGTAILVYLILWVIIPRHPSHRW